MGCIYQLTTAPLPELHAKFILDEKAGALPAAQFGGYYVNEKNVPRVLRWVPSASLIKHGFEGLCACEFPGLSFEPAPGSGGRGDLTDGDQARAFQALKMRTYP